MTAITNPPEILDPALDRAQALRRLRVLQASAVYAVCWLLLAFFSWQHTFQVPLGVVLALLGIAVVINGGLQWWIASGRNLRQRDPSLTLPQMLVATAWSFVPIYYAPSHRAEMLMVYTCVFFFGCFRLNRRQFLLVAAAALSGYFAMMQIDGFYDTTPGAAQQEVIRLLLLGVVLIILSMLGGYIFDMRQQLRKQHAALQHAHEQISRQATFDTLTGVHNRRFLMEALQREEARARRRGSQFSLIMCDLDHFKTINDRHGHLTGDGVLKRCAELLLQHLRSSDWLGHGGDELVARFGGEEFAILLPDTDLEGARQCAERLRDALARAPMPGLPPAQHQTGSFGVAQYRAGDQLHDLLTRADHALYEAKHAGRNRVVVAS